MRPDQGPSWWVPARPAWRWRCRRTSMVPGCGSWSGARTPSGRPGPSSCTAGRWRSSARWVWLTICWLGRTPHPGHACTGAPGWCRSGSADSRCRTRRSPHLPLIRQMDVETVLSRALADRGVPVERGIELTGLEGGARAPDPVRVTLRSTKGTETTTYRFVVGCDGQGSTVRTRSGTAWPGVHMLLDRDAPEPAAGLAGPHVHVHRITSTPGRGVRLVRPDDYVGYRTGTVDPARCPLAGPGRRHPGCRRHQEAGVIRSVTCPQRSGWAMPVGLAGSGRARTRESGSAWIGARRRSAAIGTIPCGWASTGSRWRSATSGRSSARRPTRSRRSSRAATSTRGAPR
jgi:hypothetical protein